MDRTDAMDTIEARRAALYHDGTCPWCGKRVARYGDRTAVEVGGRWLHAACNRELGTDLSIDELRRELASLRREIEWLRGSIRYEVLI